MTPPYGGPNDLASPAPHPRPIYLPHPMRDLFRRFAHRTSEIVGSAWAFLIAVAIIVGWAASGPMFHFTDTWQLVINTGTTIVTFLMVFVIQNTQNRDARAIHLKLDELIRATKNARDVLVDLEEMSDEDLTRLREEFRQLHEHYEANSLRLADEYDRRLGDRR
jgi:low affinity Fe/Cu permease